MSRVKRVSFELLMGAITLFLAVDSLYKWSSAGNVTATVTDMLPEKHPAAEKYRAFKRTFDTGDMIAITYSSPNLFSRESLNLIRNLTTSLEGIEGVTGASSLTSVQLPNVVNEGVEFAKLVPDDEISQITDTDLEQIRTKALGNVLVAGNLLNKDATTTAIIAETKASLSKTDHQAALVKVKAEIDKLKAQGVDLHMSSSGIVEIEIERLQLRLVRYFGFISAAFAFAWIFLTLGSLRLAIGVAIITAGISLGSIIFAAGVAGVSLDMLSIAAPAAISAIALAIGTPLFLQLQLSSAQGDNKGAPQNVWNLLTHSRHLHLLSFGIALVSGANLVWGFGPLHDFGIAIEISLGVSLFIALFFLYITTKSPSPQKLKIREPFNYKEKLLALHASWLRPAIIAAIVAVVGLGFWSLDKSPRETSPARFLAANNALQKEVIYFNNNLAGPEMIDIEATVNDPKQTFFMSGPLKVLDAVQKNFESRFKESVSRTVSLADYFKELHKAFTPGVSAENAMPEKEEDYKNYADLLELSDGKMLGKILTLDKTRARVMVSRRLQGWDVPSADRFMDEDIPKLANGQVKFEVAGLAKFVQELDNICDDISRKMILIFIAVASLIAAVGSRSLLLTAVVAVVSLMAHLTPYLVAKLTGQPIEFSITVGHSLIAIVVLTAICPLVAAFRNESSKSGKSSLNRLWQAAVDSAPEVLVTTPLIGGIAACLWFSDLGILSRLGLQVLASALCVTVSITLLLPILARTRGGSHAAPDTQLDGHGRRSDVA
ncbi:MAG: hypothetical protein RL011_592 [Pseudomonadota bacterium]